MISGLVWPRCPIDAAWGRRSRVGCGQERLADARCVQHARSLRGREHARGEDLAVQHILSVCDGRYAQGDLEGAHMVFPLAVAGCVATCRLAWECLDK